VVDFKVDHQSEQAEAGSRREVKAEIPAVAFEAQARLVAGAKPGSAVRLQGFLGAKGKRSKKLVLHVTAIEFVENELTEGA
jgi:primosomal replication protein N